MSRWASASPAPAQCRTIGDNRPYLQPNHIDEGGTNFQSFNCSPATIQLNGAGNIYPSPTATAAQSLPNVTANAPCDNQPFGDRIGRERRHNAMVKLSQDITDTLTLSADFVYSDRDTLTNNARGGIQATVVPHRPAGQPFYVNPPDVPEFQADGVTPNPNFNKQTIRWNADQLLGPGAFTDNSAKTYIATANAEWNFTENFRFTASGPVR